MFSAPFPWSLPLVDPGLLAAVDAAALGALLALLLRSRQTRSRQRRARWWRHVLVASLIGGGLGLLLVWMVGDVANAFDVPPSSVQRGAVSAVAGCAGAVVIAAVSGRGRPRRSRIRLWSASAGTLVVAILAAALTVNADVGLFRTLGEAVGQNGLGPLTLPAVTGSPTAFDPHLDRSAASRDDGSPHSDGPSEGTEGEQSTKPDQGLVGSVTIPGTVSRFPARDGYVYLPPAALADEPPKLPVVILLTGQPGDPSKMLLSGRVTETVESFAQAHDGLAPIVVIPDQLGASDANPLCVDGPLGNSATYITTDVSRWIRANLNVETDRRAWAIGGFSQGGTCALQFGAGHPELFGSFIDISGQREPHLSGGESTLEKGFSGDEKAHRHAKPATLLREHEPYHDTLGIFVVGADDSRYEPVMREMSGRAEAAGIDVVRYIPRGSGHDWKTASAGVRRGLEILWPRLGLGEAAR